MAEKKSLGKFLVYCGLLLIIFLVMTEIIFSFEGRLIRAEILIFLFLLFLVFLGFLGYKKSWGERVLFFVFLISLANLVFIWYFTSNLFMIPLFLCLVGLLIGLPKKELGELKEEEKEPQVEPYFEEEKAPKAKFIPGKYLASKMGGIYHEPRCEWARKIAPTRRLWFKDKAEAEEKGYKAHGCVR